LVSASILASSGILLKHLIPLTPLSASRYLHLHALRLLYTFFRTLLYASILPFGPQSFLRFLASTTVPAFLRSFRWIIFGKSNLCAQPRTWLDSRSSTCLFFHPNRLNPFSFFPFPFFTASQSGTSIHHSLLPPHELLRRLHLLDSLLYLTDFSLHLRLLVSRSFRSHLGRNYSSHYQEIR
jgi:hypothetical protein